MPANKNAMTRYTILDELLSNRYHNYSLDDLTEEVSNRLADMYPDTNGVVRRTIEKDIYYLEYEGPFMVDIERYDAPGYNKEKQKSFVKKCLRYSKPGFSIFKTEMSDDEKDLRSEAISRLRQFDGLPNLEALEGLRLGLGVRKKDQKIISFTKNPLENTCILGALFSSISHKQVVELHYHKFGFEDESLCVNLHPYLLKEYNRRWYLIAAAESDGKILNFALDRIDKVVPLPAHRYVEYDGDINERFEDIIGVTYYDASPIHKILFWVSDKSQDNVETKPLHESQVKFNGVKDEELRSKYAKLEGGSFFNIECRENYELIRELTSYGKELLVLKPSEIRDRVLERIYETNNSYSKLLESNR